MDMKLLESFNVINGDLCTPQGFIVNILECQFNELYSDVSILIADNPCIVAFHSNSEHNSIYNLERLQSTKGIAQAVVINAPKQFWSFAEDFSNQLGLYNENFLLAFVQERFNFDYLEFAVQFNICGVICHFGVLKSTDSVYITTDVAITYSMLELALNDVIYSDNINVFCIVTSGQAGNMAITKDNYIFKVFKDALQCVIDNL